MGEIITPEMLVAGEAATQVPPAAVVESADFGGMFSDMGEAMQMLERGLKGLKEFSSIIEKIRGFESAMKGEKNGLSSVSEYPAQTVVRKDASRAAESNQPAGNTGGSVPAGDALAVYSIPTPPTPLMVYSAVLGLVGKLEQDAKIGEALTLFHLTPDSTVGEMLALLRNGKPMILPMLEEMLK